MKAIDYDGKQVAIKCMDKTNEDDILSELMANERLGSTEHQNIIRYDTIFDDEQNVYLVSEYISDFNLMTFNYVYRKTLNEPKIKFIIRQIADGLAYCHKRMVAHRDIKLENVCIVPDTLKIKIIDFDLSLTFNKPGERYAIDCCGTYEYCAPEVLYTSVDISRLSPDYNGPLHYLYEEAYDTLTADVWAFGVLFYALVYDKFPFENPLCELKLDKTKMIGWFGKSLIKKMLNKNANKRISMDKITDHWWLR